MRTYTGEKPYECTQYGKGLKGNWHWNFLLYFQKEHWKYCMMKQNLDFKNNNLDNYFVLKFEKNDLSTNSSYLRYPGTLSGDSPTLGPALLQLHIWSFVTRSGALRPAACHKISNMWLQYYTGVRAGESFIYISGNPITRYLDFLFEILIKK